jgi:uncharacterized damage-inducible protein DinB
MSQPVLSAEEVLRWNESTSAAWRKLLGEHPEVLALPCDIARTSSVAQLLQHIVAVELRYAERIAGVPETDYEAIRFDTVENIYASHDRAVALYRKSLAGDLDWDRVIEFATRSAGKLRASLKTILFHALLHSQRHYAQLGTLVRQQGYQSAVLGDYLFMGMIRG